MSTGAEVQRSNLTIPAGEMFELGGGQAGSFDLRVKNVGPTHVEVRLEGAESLYLEPGATEQASISAGDMARLRNASKMRPAHLKVVFVQSNPEDFLGMRYVEAPAEK